MDCGGNRRQDNSPGRGGDAPFLLARDTGNLPQNLPTLGIDHAQGRAHRDLGKEHGAEAIVVGKSDHRSAHRFPGGGPALYLDEFMPRGGGRYEGIAGDAQTIRRGVSESFGNEARATVAIEWGKTQECALMK